MILPQYHLLRYSIFATAHPSLFSCYQMNGTFYFPKQHRVAGRNSRNSVNNNIINHSIISSIVPVIHLLFLQITSQYHYFPLQHIFYNMIARIITDLSYITTIIAPVPQQRNFRRKFGIFVECQAMKCQQGESLKNPVVLWRRTELYILVF